MTNKELKQKIAELEELIREAYPLLEEVQTKFGSNAAMRAERLAIKIEKMGLDD